jgi:hypothetical protein
MYVNEWPKRENDKKKEKEIVVHKFDRIRQIEFN